MMKSVMRQNSSLISSYYAELYNGEPFFEIDTPSIVCFNYSGTSKVAIDKNNFQILTGYTESNGYPLSASNSHSMFLVSASAIKLHSTSVIQISGPSHVYGNTYNGGLQDVTNVGIVLEGINKLSSNIGGYVRHLIGINSVSSPNRFIDIGQTGTTLIDGIRMLPGNTGHVAIHSGSSEGGETMRVTDGSVGIGITVPDASAKLQVNSTTQGFLPPKMTTSQRNAINSPAAGLMIYNTDTNKINFHNGTEWRIISDTAA